MEDACKTNYKPVFSPVTYWTYKTDPYLGCYSVEQVQSIFWTFVFKLILKFYLTKISTFLSIWFKTIHLNDFWYFKSVLRRWNNLKRPKITVPKVEITTIWYSRVVRLFLRFSSYFKKSDTSYSTQHNKSFIS